MRQWIALMMVVAVLGITLTGCINVKAPDGPYVKLDDGSASDGNHDAIDMKDVQKLLEDARKDGVITKTQYEQLRKRLEKACKA